MGVRLQLPAHHHAGQSGDMEGRGHGRPFRQDPEASGSGGWSPQLPSYSRIQSLLYWSANHHWTQEHPREGDREDLPQGGQDHLAELETRTVVYVNGEPICARPPNKTGEYAELGNVTRDSIKADEVEFVRVAEGRVKENGGKLKYVDINKKEHEAEAKELKSLSQVMEEAKADFPGLVHMRVPVCNSASPLETDFDVICETLVGTSINTPVIVTDQVGLSRATTGSVIACLFKEFQINVSFEGLVETVPGVNLDLLKMDKYTMDPSKDPLFRGEFPVVLALLEKLKGGKEAKNECDKVIDKNGTPRPEATASSSSGRTSPSPSCPTRSWTTQPRLSSRSRSWTTFTSTTTSSCSPPT